MERTQLTTDIRLKREKSKAFLWPVSDQLTMSLKSGMQLGSIQDLQEIGLR